MTHPFKVGERVTMRARFAESYPEAIVKAGYSDRASSQAWTLCGYVLAVDDSHVRPSGRIPGFQLVTVRWESGVEASYTHDSLRRK